MRRSCNGVFKHNSDAKILSQSVASINTKIRPGDILGCVGEEEGHGAHQVFGDTHFADGDKRNPFIAELGVFVEDFAGAEKVKSIHI